MIYRIIKNTVRENKKLILDTLDYIWKNPETGFKEFKTSAYLEKIFKDLGYELIKPDDIPGFYTVIDTGKPGPEILIMGELDALICKTHKDADKETGAVHCCGHAAQCAALIGVAAALKNEEILKTLCGKVRLCAVPAEELIEIEYRTKLKNEGKIRYYSGKSEFLSRGYFDGVDLAFMVHTTPETEFFVNLGSNGFVVKQISYKGKSAHAGGSPWNGVNALYAANLGLSAINAIRETFKEEDTIRVHPIITEGGTVVNAIPERVKLESFVRGRNFEAILRANKNVNRALIGGAVSLGANVEIFDIPGCAPLNNNEELIKISGEALENVCPDKKLKVNTIYSTGSTDMGDLGCLMPVIHPYAPGAEGISHGDNYYIKNPDSACLDSAMWQVSILYSLLSDDGRNANAIISEYDAPFKSKDEYLRYLDGICCDGDRIIYDDNQTIVKL